MTSHFVNLLDDLRRRSLRMASAVEDVLSEACEATQGAHHNLAARVIQRDDDIDEEEVAVEAEVIRLIALFQPMGSDMRLLCTILKVNNDLERIADCAVNIAERVLHLADPIRPDHDHELQTMITTAKRIFRHAIRAYTEEDVERARSVLIEDDTIDAAYAQFMRRMVTETPRTTDQMAAFMDLLSIAKNLERIADHSVNIAEDVVFLATGQIVRHRTP